MISEQMKVYKDKGAWLVVAWAVAIGFFLYFPELAKAVWPTVLTWTRGSDYNMFVYGLSAYHVLMFVLGNSVFAALYCLNLPFFEKYKIEPGPWPWRKSPQARKEYFALVRSTFGLLLFNWVCVIYPLSILGYEKAKAYGFTAAMDAIPPWYVIMGQVALFVLAEDCMFYWAHRTLHWKPIYPYIHKLHHSYHTSVGIASEYTHPVEFLFANVIPFVAVSTFLGSHAVTLLAWATIRVLETIDGHCGYDLPWSPFRILPFSGSSRHHDYHHSHNLGNYGSFFTVWDHTFGTDVDYVKFIHKQEKSG